MKRKIRSFFLIIFCLVIVGLILGCGGGGGGGDSTPTTSNSAYPDVAGLYSFRTNAMKMTCSDSSTPTVDAITQNDSITQNINQILIQNTSTSPPPVNLTILSNSSNTGSVDPSGNFITNQIIVATVTNTPGNNTFIYNLTGTFAATGWSGIWKYTMYNDYYKVSCTGNTPFTGELISKSVAIKSPSEQAEADGTPVKEESVFDLAAHLLGLSADGSDPNKP